MKGFVWLSVVWGGFLWKLRKEIRKLSVTVQARARRECVVLRGITRYCPLQDV